MKPFNLERALLGESVVTRDGRKVDQIFYAHKAGRVGLKVIAVIEGTIRTFHNDGFWDIKRNASCHDLFMESKKVNVERWMNVYPNKTFIYDTKKEADERASEDRIACVCLKGEYEPD